MNFDRRLMARMQAWKKDPLLFVRDNFKATPDDWQADFLLSIRDNQRTGAKACKGPGKSCGMAWGGWWFLGLHPHAKGFATSITAENLRDNLWAELAYWRKKSPFLLEYFDWSAERVFAKESPETWFLSARTWPKQADKTQQANTLAGLHGEYTIVLVDECGDIPAGVVSAADASLTNGKMNRIVIAGNPTRTDGPLYDACTKQSDMWKMIEITGDPDDPKRSKRISVEWAREQIKLWGRDNPWVLVNVLGQFPPQQSDKLIGVTECELAASRVYRTEEIDGIYPLVMGVDVARFGDDCSVISLRQGPVLYPQTVFRNLDLMTLASQIAAIHKEKQPFATFIDETGMGAGVVDRLRQLGVPVVGVNFGSKATDGRFVDKRSEMWWNMAEWVKKNAALPKDPSLNGELAGPTYSFNLTSKLRLESKDDMKKRGLQSPNKADSVALTFAEPVSLPPWYGTEWAGKRDVSHHAVFEYDPYKEIR